MDIKVKWFEQIHDRFYRSPFIATIDSMEFAGYLKYINSSGFTIYFDNKLIIKHPEYRSIRRVVLSTYRHKHSLFDDGWLQEALESFQRA